MKEDLDYNKLNIIQKQNVIQKLNYKRYSKIRWNLLLNFVIGLVFCIQLNFNSYSLSDLNTWITLSLIGVYFLISIPGQIYFYYTKLPTKNYQINLTYKHLKLYYVQFLITLINLLWFIFSLRNINTLALMSYVIIVLIFILINVYYVMWMKKVLLTQKDKYYLIIKNIFLTLKKAERKF